MYAKAAEYTTFPQNTYVNGVDCSGQSEQKAEELISKEYNAKEYTITCHGSTEKLRDFGLHFDIQKSLKREMIFANMKRQIIGDDVRLDQHISMKSSDDSKKLILKLKSLKINDQNVVKTHNAYIDMEDENFPIIEEVYGKNIDISKLSAKVREDIANDVFQLDFVPEEYYEIPTITKDDKDLIKKQEYCRQYLAQKIVYDMSGQEYKIPAKDLDKMIYLDEDNNVKVDQDQVKKFVRKLAHKYDTYGKARLFKSTKRGQITVKGGNYGFLINQPKERAKLSKDLLAGKDIKRTPVYTSKGATRGFNDIGNTYVEVSILDQHMWYYQGGKVVLESDIVSGCKATGHNTYRGVYSLMYKSKDVTLKGSNDDGTKYETFVSYWMPFYADQGLHDASWRGAFGGNIYEYSGSHGCVNLPVHIAKALFEKISAGCPVVIY